MDTPVVFKGSVSFIRTELTVLILGLSQTPRSSTFPREVNAVFLLRVLQIASF